MKISVCMATHNGEKYIKPQLLSILSQIGDGSEVIISDDGSTDNTIEEIESIKDIRINIYRYVQPKKENRHSIYAMRNFENALKKAKGEYVFFSDQDDIWLPNKVALFLSLLKSCDLVVGDCKVVDDKLNVLHESAFDLIGAKPGFCSNLYKNAYTGCSMAFRKELLIKCLPIPKGLIAHDIWIGLMGEFLGKVAFLDEPTLLYRRHGNNISPSSEKSRNTWYYKIYYRLIIVIVLMLRLLKLKVLS